MSRAPEQLAPSWLPRQQRRRINRQLHRLLQRDVCSVCGSLFKHNSRTTSGLDTQGSVGLDDEAVAHALFDAAMRPADSETLRTLVKKYQANGAAS